MSEPLQAGPALSSTRRKDVYSATFIVVLGVYVFLEASKMPDFGRSVQSPGMFPAFLAICLGVLGGVLLGQSLWPSLAGAKGEDTRSEPGDAGEALSGFASARQQAVIIAVMTALGFAYICLLPRIHFFWDTLAFLVVAILYLSPKRNFTGVAVAVVATLAIQLLFAEAFKVLLP